MKSQDQATTSKQQPPPASHPSTTKDALSPEGLRGDSVQQQQQQSSSQQMKRALSPQSYNPYQQGFDEPPRYFAGGEGQHPPSFMTEDPQRRFTSYQYPHSSQCPHHGNEGGMPMGMPQGGMPQQGMPQQGMPMGMGGPPPRQFGEEGFYYQQAMMARQQGGSREGNPLHLSQMAGRGQSGGFPQHSRMQMVSEIPPQFRQQQQQEQPGMSPNPHSGPYPMQHHQQIQQSFLSRQNQQMTMPENQRSLSMSRQYMPQSEVMQSKYFAGGQGGGGIGRVGVALGDQQNVPYCSPRSQLDLPAREIVGPSITDEKAKVLLQPDAKQGTQQASREYYQQRREMAGMGSFGSSPYAQRYPGMGMSNSSQFDGPFNYYENMGAASLQQRQRPYGQFFPSHQQQQSMSMNVDDYYYPPQRARGTPGIGQSQYRKMNSALSVQNINQFQLKRPMKYGVESMLQQQTEQDNNRMEPGPFYQSPLNNSMDMARQQGMPPSYLEGRESMMMQQGRPPFAEGRPPFAEGRPPFAEGRPPFAEGRPPFAEGRPPFADGRMMMSQGGPPPSYLEGRQQGPPPNHFGGAHMQSQRFEGAPPMYGAGGYMGGPPTAPGGMMMMRGGMEQMGQQGGVMPYERRMMDYGAGYDRDPRERYVQNNIQEERQLIQSRGYDKQEQPLNDGFNFADIRGPIKYFNQASKQQQEGGAASYANF